MLFAECDPFCALQACYEGVQVETVMSEIDIFVSSTGIITLDHIKKFRNSTFVGQHRTLWQRDRRRRVLGGLGSRQHHASDDRFLFTVGHGVIVLLQSDQAIIPYSCCVSSSSSGPVDEALEGFFSHFSPISKKVPRQCQIIRRSFRGMKSSILPRQCQLIHADRSSNGSWRSHSALAESSRTRARSTKNFSFPRYGRRRLVS